MKNIAILGSTGSIGTQTLEIVRNHPDLRVVALAAGSSVEKMEEQIREFHPLKACMWSEQAAADLRVRVADLEVEISAGMEGLLEIAVLPASQVLVTAIVGMIGIRPTIAAIQAGKDIALANKETLVTAGHIIMPLAERHFPVPERRTGRQKREAGGLVPGNRYREDPADRIRRTLSGKDQKRA